MLLAFELSMPGTASWDGRWGGEGRLYARIVSVGRSQDAQAKAQAMIDTRRYSYDFGDGWVAAVDVRAVTPNEARRIRRDSKGFYGYDWMIDSIRRVGSIQPTTVGS